jgi:hypothetical protein
MVMLKGGGLFSHCNDHRAKIAKIAKSDGHGVGAKFLLAARVCGNALIGVGTGFQAKKKAQKNPMFSGP